MSTRAEAGCRCNRSNPGGAVSSSSLVSMGREIARETGAHLFVKVVDDGSPAMDWHTVSIPRDVLEGGENRVKCTLLHEWGHRIVSPRSLERAVALAVRLNLDSDVGYEEAFQITNLACDLWVDDALLKHPTWGDEYFENMAAEIDELRDLQSTEGVNGPAAGIRRLLDLISQVESARAEAAGFEAPIPVRLSTARKILGYLFDLRLDEHTRIRQLLDDVRSLLGPLWKQRRVRRELERRMPRFLLEALQRGGVLEIVDLPKLSQELVDAGISWGSVADAVGAENGSTKRRLAAKIRRLQCYSRLMRRLEQSLLSACEERPDGWQSWTTSHPPERLDLEATLGRCGIAIPELTTLQPVVDSRLSGPGYGRHVCIVVDDSGSTSGDVNRCEVEAALGLVEAARHFGDRVSLVAFGDRVTVDIDPCLDYENVAESIALLDSESGCTNLVPALERARSMVWSCPANTSHVVILTDTAVSDLEDSLCLLQRISLRSRVTVFAFQEDGRVMEFAAALRAVADAVLYASEVGDGFSEASLRELVTWRSNGRGSRGS